MPCIAVPSLRVLEACLQSSSTSHKRTHTYLALQEGTDGRRLSNHTHTRPKRSPYCLWWPLSGSSDDEVQHSKVFQHACFSAVDDGYHHFRILLWTKRSRPACMLDVKGSSTPSCIRPSSTTPLDIAALNELSRLHRYLLLSKFVQMGGLHLFHSKLDACTGWQSLSASTTHQNCDRHNQPCKN